MVQQLIISLLVSDITFYEVQLFNHLVEIIIYLSRTHQMRSKYYIFSEGLGSRIGQLLSAPQKHLKLTALRFFRQCVGLQDEHYNKELITKRHFGPILSIVYETMPRDNLLNSACLELFEYIKRENLKPLIRHLAEDYGSRLREITYVDTFETILLRYDQMMNVQDADMTLFSSEAGVTTPPNQQRGNVNGNRGWQGVKEMDADEEAYFNTSDDEEDFQDQRDSPTAKRLKISPKSTTPLSNGVASSPLLKSLVDYPDDEEDDLIDSSSSSPFKPRHHTQQPILPSSPSPSESGPRLAPSPILTTPPPHETLREKRRREQDDDDEDELGKLSSMGNHHHKRRNPNSSSGASNNNPSIHNKDSSSSNSTGSTSNSSTLRHKKAFGASSKTADTSTFTSTASSSSPVKEKDRERERDRDRDREKEKERKGPAMMKKKQKKMEIHIGANAAAAAKDKDKERDAGAAAATATITPSLSLEEEDAGGGEDIDLVNEVIPRPDHKDWEKEPGEKVEPCG